MRLIRCHIENFGKLENQDIIFSNGCQCFLHENGWGKSTLAAFLTVMLYGFDKERSRDDYACERRRYRPWQGGVYGGSLTFSVNDKVYTAERIFGMKEKEDRFFLREETTNLESRAFSERLGEELFHLDRASFEKTVFLSQNDCSTRTTDRIQAKLGNLTEATDDINSYEQADARLNDRLNAMSPLRKTGSLYRMKEQITDLESELRKGDLLEQEMENLLKDKKKIEDAYSKYKAIQEELLMKQKEMMFHDERKKETAVRKEEEKHLMKKESKNRMDGKLCFLAVFGISFLLLSLFFFQRYQEASLLFLIAGILLTGVCFIWLIRGKKLSKVNDNINNLVTREDDCVSEEGKYTASEDREQCLEELQQRLRKIQYLIENAYRKKVHFEHEIHEKRKKRERLFEKEEQLCVLKEQYASDSLKYERLKLTRHYLAQAKASYLAKYRNPLMQAFAGYYEMISGDSPEHFKMDANLELTNSEYGCQRESRYYSAGWKDLMGICMRMALVEVMFREEKPFFIMDDPFVNLDKEKMQAALDFVRAVGEEYQILYFTCHESRIF